MFTLKNKLSKIQTHNYAEPVFTVYDTAKLLKATIVTHSFPASGVIRFIIRTHFQEHLKTSSKCCIITVKYLIFKICIFFIL